MNENKFEYTYSALSEEEKKKIESIAKKYRDEKAPISPLERIRKLDKKIQNTATMSALIAGIVGCLIFGGGLALVLEFKKIVIGIVLMVIGCVPMAAAYPTYNFFFQRGKKKYGEEILRLSEEILKK